MSHHHVIIVAGGSGSRMGSELPKQFLNLRGKPILMRTIEAFFALTPKPAIILVLPASQISLWSKLCEEHQFNVELKVVAGGNTRFQSVRNGLSQIPADDSLVAIHDGVRPLVSAEVIQRCYELAAKKGNAIPVVKPVESVRIDDGQGSKGFDRDKVLLVQTPQVFSSNLIKECYSIAEQPSFTDDASVAEFCGVTIHTTEGNRENIKITTPTDLILAEALLNHIQK